ncbi:MAG: DUF1805 domain-containing protein [bacterium]
MRDVSVREMADGKAVGVSAKWDKGQFCFILTEKGVLGCAIFNPAIFDEENFAGAFLRGTPGHYYVEPEDLLEGRVDIVTREAEKLGIEKGMKGDRALEKLLP